MKKIHFSEEQEVSIYCKDPALYSWEQEDLIPYEYKACTGLMMRRKDREFLTNVKYKVTCKHCLKQIKKRNL